jgi:hypothetical protein
MSSKHEKFPTKRESHLEEIRKLREDYYLQVLKQKHGTQTKTQCTLSRNTKQKQEPSKQSDHDQKSIFESTDQRKRNQVLIPNPYDDSFTKQKSPEKDPDTDLSDSEEEQTEFKQRKQKYKEIRLF